MGPMLLNRSRLLDSSVAVAATPAVAKIPTVECAIAKKKPTVTGSLRACMSLRVTLSIVAKERGKRHRLPFTGWCSGSPPWPAGAYLSWRFQRLMGADTMRAAYRRRSPRKQTFSLRLPVATRLIPDATASGAIDVGAHARANAGGVACRREHAPRLPVLREP
jgi:hypothetical protein